MGFFETTDEEFYQEMVSRPLEEKIKQALDWILEYQDSALELSPKGYYVAFSGGKDSIVLERLFSMAGVKYHSWYNNTTIDPPELIYFIKKYYPEVKWNNPDMPLMQRMVKKTCGPPTRLARWCCTIYKEQGGLEYFRAIGVRGEESTRRKTNWTFLNSDRKTGNPILCPLYYWREIDIWQFIYKNKMPYCELYDQGFKRLGCVGCPMGGPKQVKYEFQRWPRYEKLWKRAFAAYWSRWKGTLTLKGEKRWIEKFQSVDELWEWWISGGNKKTVDPCQLWLW